MDIESNLCKDISLVPENIIASDLRCLKRPIGCYNIMYIPETGSTNDLAKTMAKQKNAPHGTVIISDCQHSGRGKGRSQWFSPPGLNIYISVILRPETGFPQTLMNVISSLSVVSAIKETCNLTVWPKWPNDIYCGNKKLGGILAESSVAGNSLSYIVTGIGINVNVTAFPDSLNDTATSISLETNKNFERGNIVESLLKYFINYCEQLKHDKHSLVKTWESISRTINSTITIQTVSEALSGRAVGINEDGFLIVKKPDGTSVLLKSGEITHVVGN
ncbi:MAG: biotin--[acetyl-CoA-carboxylase] ligase [Nitrospirae bacterium YQR-1]